MRPRSETIVQSQEQADELVIKIGPRWIVGQDRRGDDPQACIRDGREMAPEYAELLLSSVPADGKLKWTEAAI